MKHIVIFGLFWMTMTSDFFRFAISLGSLSDYLPIDKKIKNGFTFKVYFYDFVYRSV